MQHAHKSKGNVCTDNSNLEVTGVPAEEQYSEGYIGVRLEWVEDSMEGVNFFKKSNLKMENKG